MKILLLALMAALLSGCVIDHRKSEPQSFTAHSRMQSAASFIGTYENEAIDYASRPQATLAEYEFGYWQPGIKQVDSVSIYIDVDGSISFLGMVGGTEKFRSTYMKDEGYSFDGRKIRFSGSSFSASPDSMVVGRQSQKSSATLTADGSLVYSTKSSFRGLAYGFIPASTSHERTSIFGRVKNEPTK